MECEETPLGIRFAIGNKSEVVSNKEELRKIKQIIDIYLGLYF